MEEDNRSETMLASANLGTPESLCSFELTLSNSEASSLTAENSKDILHHSANATPDYCMTWTDEEHNKYLDHLELSFVKQLHYSMGLLACCTGQSDRRPCQKQPADFNRSSEEFTVLQDSQCQKINFAKDQSRSHTAAADSFDALKSRRIHSLRRASKDFSTASADLQEFHEFHGEEKKLKRKRTFCGPASCPEQNCLCYSCCQNSVVSIEEGTGQNFVEEDHEENPNIVSQPKRLKTAVGDTSSKDQIVPCSMA